MHITYLHQYFVKPEQNGGSRTYEMTKRLVRAGHRVDVITSDRALRRSGRKTWRVEDVNGARVHYYPVPYDQKMGVMRRLVAFLEFAVVSSFRARKLNSDLVFATSTPLTIGIPGLIAVLGRRSPFVFEVRDLWPAIPIAMGALKNPIMRAAAVWLEKTIYRRADAIVALSPEMKAGVVETGYSEDRVSVIPNGSDLDTFADADTQGAELIDSRPEFYGKKLAVYCGTFGPAKYVRYIIDLADRVRSIDDTILFYLVGEGPEKDELVELAAKRSLLNSTVYFDPGVPKENVCGIFGAATINISTVADIPGLAGNSANKVFDSFAAGRPIAINHGGWQAEILERSGAGVVLSPEASDADARRFVEFVNDEAGMARARRSAKNLAETEFARDNLAAKLIDVFDDVLSSNEVRSSR
ncbi:glycosyltransferase family 4 protein [Zhihengliuella sp.]|uniref:glycosyltransferase family 4 protein n=1 Tax=Zhihengliuella sp. TaxID=1954483 RepID=UPI002811D20C|nr:glycosyltransferase family 4 protein [Zhihengliuella sp.]